MANSRVFSGLKMLCATAVCLLPTALYASDKPFIVWVEEFKKEAVGQGISQSVLDQAFNNLAPNARVIALDRKQPEGTMTFAQYKERVVNPKRIEEGRRLLAQHRELLEKIGARYGVQPRFIVALWGIETNFGKNTGGFNLVEALATLAYDGRRAEFFRKELLNALHIVNGGHVTLDKFKGSWAGAMGQCQFMPTSFLSFAEDGDGDGKKDIWTDQEDVFASIANYLAKSGWNKEQTWGREVRIPAGFDRSLAGTKQPERSLEEWARLGVRAADGNDLPKRADIMAVVVFPDEKTDEAYLAYNNYKTVLKWNRSLYFATSVGIISDAINGK